jgi:hypothetical protein
MAGVAQGNCAPLTVKRLAIIVGPENPLSPRYVQVLEASNPAREMLLIATTVRDTDEIEHAIRAFAHEPNGGLLVLPSITPRIIARRSLNSPRYVACQRFTHTASSPPAAV